MGYTHYFRGLGCTEELVDFAENAVSMSGVSIKDPSGDETPDLVRAGARSRIGLNGDAELEQDFESFEIPGESYCKTGRRPYDKVVTAVLIAAIAYKAPGWEHIGSDGNASDWDESGGIDLFIEVYEKMHGKKIDKQALMKALDAFLCSPRDDAGTKAEKGKLLSDICNDAADDCAPHPGTKMVQYHPGVKMIQVRYHSGMIDRLDYIDGKSDWIDLRAAKEYQIREGTFTLIDLGVSVRLPAGYEMIIAPRSSTFKNYGLLQTNGIGVIDESYCGDNDILRMPVYATRDTVVHINDRICQFRIQKHQPKIQFEEMEYLGETNRGGFGSTGKN